MGGTGSRRGADQPDQPGRVCVGAVAGMKVQATLYLAKRQKPMATRAKDGAFCVTMRAFDRSQPHHTEPWFLIFPGDAAAEFWEQHGADLRPGDQLCVQAENLRCIQARGKNSAEIHATVTHMQVHPIARAPDVAFVGY